jgi:alkylation response protein AidB-like acyl-CoA dehydrogenase
MEFIINQEQEIIRDTIKKFVANECLREAVRKQDESGEFPANLYQKFSEMGFCGLTIPEAYGGGGPNILGAVLVVEEIATMYPALAAAFIASAFCGGNIISTLGSPQQKQRFLPELVPGSLLFAYALKEYDDSYGNSLVKTQATKAGDGFLLSGTKASVRLADRADYLITLASTEPKGNPVSGLTLFVVNAQDKGITIHPVEKVGFDSMSLCRVAFKDVAVTAADILGGPGMLNRGQEMSSAIVESEHLEVAGTAIGLAQGAYSYATQYAKERIQFGKPIVNFGAVRNLLVEMAIKIKSARLLTYEAAWLQDQCKRFSTEATMARINAIDAAHTAALNCVQVLGGYGYANEYDAQRYLRDALVLLTGGETIEILKTSIGEMLDLQV